MTHLVRKWERIGGGLWPTLWCGEPVGEGVNFTSEALFNQCEKCAAARDNGAHEVKPT